MKKQTKGIIFTVLFGGGLLFWATAASLPGIMPPQEEQQSTVTGTPAVPVVNVEFGSSPNGSPVTVMPYDISMLGDLP